MGGWSSAGEGVPVVHPAPAGARAVQCRASSGAAPPSRVPHPGRRPPHTPWGPDPWSRRDPPHSSPSLLLPLFPAVLPSSPPTPIWEAGGLRGGSETGSALAVSCLSVKEFSQKFQCRSMEEGAEDSSDGCQTPLAVPMQPGCAGRKHRGTGLLPRAWGGGTP